jgi:N-acetyl-anhydromuramyl-L-alanine amidase AmpD
VTIASNGTYTDNGAKWAQLEHARIVGHVTLDPGNKTDPGPELIDWIKSRGAPTPAAAAAALSAHHGPPVCDLRLAA